MLTLVGDCDCDSLALVLYLHIQQILNFFTPFLSLTLSNERSIYVKIVNLGVLTLLNYTKFLYLGCITVQLFIIYKNKFIGVRIKKTTIVKRCLLGSIKGVKRPRLIFFTLFK